MNITQEDRLKILEDIKNNLGFVEREDNEFTAKEIAGCFGIAGNVTAFFEKNEIEYTRRKAVASGRRQFVYRVIIEK